MIDFNRPPVVGTELKYIQEAFENHKLCGDGPFTKKCSAMLAEKLNVKHVLLTTSATHALEMAAYLCDIQPGDEVILPSFTFCSTADAFVLQGAKLVFVDVRPDTMNIDETKIEEAITEKTKVIVPVHYAGVACEMDTIMDIAKRHHLKVVEDAAQAISSYYKGRPLGTIGDFGCFSFHETKNYSMGEGGALVFNDDEMQEKAEILREKGTNRTKFFRGQVDKYSWVDFGSSYLPSELNAAYLYAQLEVSDKIDARRVALWERYHEAFADLEKRGLIERPTLPEYTTNNAHMYYLKVKDLDVRTRLIRYLKEAGIVAVFHYVPLHSAPAGIKYGRFHGEDIYTTADSDRLVRLPMFYNLTDEDQDRVIERLLSFPDFQA